VEAIKRWCWRLAVATHSPPCMRWQIKCAVLRSRYYVYVVGDRSQLAVDGQMVGILIINQARVCAQRGGPAARTCRYLHLVAKA